MLCQKCSARTSVTDSRIKEGNMIRRRHCPNRRCDQYKVNFKTIEQVLAVAPKKRKPKPAPVPKQKPYRSKAELELDDWLKREELRRLTGEF